MSKRELPEFERLPRPELPTPRAGRGGGTVKPDGGDKYYEPKRRRFNPFLLAGIPIFAVISMYSALAVVTQLDATFLPGNEFKPGPISIVPGIDDGENPDFATEEERINVLIMGLDLRRDEPNDQPARTDTIMILSIDPFSKTAGAFSIPRDTWVEIPDGNGGYRTNKINVAYEYGDLYDYPGGGPASIKDTIKHNFDIDVDNYVVLNFNNFINIIDELGGIDVTIPEYAVDYQYHDCNSCPYYVVEFEPGTEHMDGERALAYARIRASDNDFKRIERQQIVLKATARKAASLGSVLDNPIGLYNAYKGSVKTDISEFRVPGLGKLLGQIDLDNVPTISMGDIVYACPSTICGEASALLWEDEKLELLKNQVFAPELNSPLINESAVVSVKNGTITPDLATEFASFLSDQGIRSSQIKIDEYYGGQLADTSAIFDLNGKDVTSKALADWLGLPYTSIHGASHPDAGEFVDEASTSDVVVVIGADANVPLGGAASNSSETGTAGG